MSCDWREDRAYSFAEGSLSAMEEEEFGTHLPGCPRCRSLVSEARAVDGLLRSALAPVAAPTTLASRLAGAVAQEAESRRGRRWGLPLGRLSLSPVSVLAMVLALLAATYLMAPGAVMAVVQRALLFVPGLGIRTVDQGHLVAPAPVAVRSGDLTFRVEALLSDGETTTVGFSLSGLPGGKGEKAAQVGSGEPPTTRPKAPPPFPRLRDPLGREYQLSSGHFGIGGSPSENTITGQLNFGPLPVDLESVDLVMPSAWLDLASLARGAAPESWTVRIPLAPASSAGLPVASPRGDSATARGVTLQVAALSTEPGRTVVLLESKTVSGARVTAVGKNGGNISKEVVLRDDLGREYPLSPRSRTTLGDQPYREDLYFATLAPLAQQLTLSVQSVRLTLDGSATVSIPLDGLQPGKELPLGRTVELGGNRVVLESARVEGGWLYVNVDAGPTVAGRTLSSFSVDGPRSFMVTMGRMDGEQIGQFGVEIQPGERLVELELSRPLVNLEGPWEIIFPVQSKTEGQK